MSDFQFNIPEEIWKDIPELPGYQVSNLGRVRSFLRIVGIGAGGGTKRVLDKNPQRILKPLPCCDYFRVRLHHRKFYLIHRLVLLAFVGPCPPGQECRHLDGSRTNNQIHNLSWGTCTENAQDRVKHRSDSIPKGNKHYRSKFTESHIRAIRYLYSIGFRLATLSRMYLTHRSNIRKIIHKDNWKHI